MSPEAGQRSFRRPSLGGPAFTAHVASHLALCFAVGAAAPLCFSDGVAEGSRDLLPNGLPVGLWVNDWDSAQLVTQVAKVLINEKLGTHAVITGYSDSSRAAMFELAGCSEDNRGVNCPSGSVPADYQHHTSLECWDTGANAIPVIEKAPQRLPEIIDIGYEGIEGMFVPASVRQRGWQERGWHLEWYGDYHARWHTPWDLFVSLDSVDTSGLYPCSATGLASYVQMDKVRRFTPDPGGFTADGRAFCPDGFWWLSPACRSNTSRCVPWITGGDGWGLDWAMQRAIEYSIPLAVAVAGSWDEYVAVPRSGAVMLYSWEPSLHYLKQEPELVLFPPADLEAQAEGDGRTSVSSTPLKTLIAVPFVALAPRIHTFLTRIRFNRADVKALLELYYDLGDYEAAACGWLKNHSSSWPDWIPDERQCTTGRGLVDAEGRFVEDMHEAVGCEPCPSGRFSEALPESGSRACRRCLPGASQPMWGLDSCTSCAEGYFQASIGEPSCERCGKGSYAAGEGNTQCSPCPLGTTTDGTGFSSITDCRCPPGSASKAEGGACFTCGEGASCRGFGSMPEALPGYHLDQVFEDRLRIFRCEHDMACPGGGEDVCGSGRSGIACSTCEAGSVERPDGHCSRCLPADLLPLLVLLFGGAGSLVALYLHAATPNKSRQSVAAAYLTGGLVQALFVLQIMGVLSRIAVSWPEPVNSLLKALEFVTLDLDHLVNLSCIATTTPCTRYFMQALLTPIMGLFLLTVHVVHSTFFYPGQLARRSWALIGALGVLVLGLYLAISGQALSPLRCRANPSGDWTMHQSPGVVCWHTATHAQMLAIGAVALTLPLCFLSLVAFLLYILPHRVSIGDVEFLNTFSFLFNKVSVERRWFMFFILVRNLIMALTPSIPNGFWQTLILSSLCIVSVCAVARYMPWRLKFSNYIDFATTVMVLFLVLVSTAFLEPTEIWGLPTVALVFSLMSLLTFTAYIAVACWKRLWRRGGPSQYTFFICHQKSAAGACARLLKMFLVNLRPGTEVFLDSDNLLDLTSLFTIVRNEVESVVVLCSREIFDRPWCLGEITTAHLYSVSTLPVLFPDFSPPGDEFIDGMVACNILTESGLRLSEVQAAVRWLCAQDSLVMPLRLSDRSVQKLCNDIMKRVYPYQQFSRSKSGSISASASGDALERFGHVVVADTGSCEVAASVLIYQRLMRPLVANAGLGTQHLPVLYSPQPGSVWNVDPNAVLVIFCSPGCFSECAFLASLMGLVAANVSRVVPVVIDEAFKFPTPDFYGALEDIVRRLCIDTGAFVQPKLLHPFVQSVFKKICLRLHMCGGGEVLGLEVRRTFECVLAATSWPRGALAEREEYFPIMAQIAWVYTQNFYQDVPDVSQEEGPSTAESPEANPELALDALEVN